MGLFDFFKKKDVNVEEQAALNKGLEKTKEGLFSKITKAVIGKTTVDEEVLDDLEEVLVTSDVGVNLAIFYGMSLIIFAVILGIIYNFLCSRYEDDLNQEESKP